jgi:hypothetical protein
MPTQTFFASGPWPVPDYVGVLTVTITGGAGGGSGTSSPLSNAPFCDTASNLSNVQGGVGGYSGFDNFVAGGGGSDAGGSVVVCTIPQFYYRPGMLVPIVVGAGGQGGQGIETGCGGSTTGGNGVNGTVVMAWTNRVSRGVVPV